MFIRTGYAEWVQDDIDRSTVFHKWHVFDWQDAGNNTFVTVAATELVADRDLAHLGDKDLDLHDDAGFEFVAVGAGEDFNADNFAVLAVAHAL